RQALAVGLAALGGRAHQRARIAEQFAETPEPQAAFEHVVARPQILVALLRTLQLRPWIAILGATLRRSRHPRAQGSILLLLLLDEMIIRQCLQPAVEYLDGVFQAKTQILRFL